MLRLSTTLAVALPAAHAILVTPGSPCSTSCGNVLDSTSTADIVCDEAGPSGAAAQLFQGCVECEMGSGYFHNNQSDVQSVLYNLRYAVSYCLFGVPINENLVNNPCITSKACGPFLNAIEYKNLSSTYKSYEYCQRWPMDINVDYRGCTECLQAAESFHLANFVTVLEAGCEQRPAPGIGLGLEGNVFSSDYVNVTAPSPTVAVDPNWFDQGPLNLSAKVGIAVGGLVLLLTILGCAIVLNGKRRRRAYLRRLEAKYVQRGWPAPNGQGEKPDAPMSQPRPSRGWDDTPVSQQPLRGWDDSPMTVSTENAYPRYFSPYSSQYNSPVSARNSPSTHMPLAALGITQDIGVALGDDDGAGAQSTASPSEGKGKVRQEAYEMHQVDSAGSSRPREDAGVPRTEAPVLCHPGFGRTSNSLPRQYALSEADANSGSAI
ncbi:centromere/microtubule binding protein cbf5-like protein [Hirsutella rhossiliensis]|uniref:Centromere/microtubule binding protein cbf5-like protein n=1 Tax=Hirsutella rhossiliensis TaxID=111463 RepID=A0A9P8SKA8_9HYPO|nr:centromere/microtubule binding protein cbf5-like protein [Hirsutella rhossiliensis]KAH0965059.1 centromere/microtubule binding protein cbf5-like protein [Hirsutella rhossiliensis]